MPPEQVRTSLRKLPIGSKIAFGVATGLVIIGTRFLPVHTPASRISPDVTRISPIVRQAQDQQLLSAQARFNSEIKSHYGRDLAGIYSHYDLQPQHQKALEGFANIHGINIVRLMLTFHNSEGSAQEVEKFISGMRLSDGFADTNARLAYVWAATHAESGKNAALKEAILRIQSKSGRSKGTVEGQNAGPIVSLDTKLKSHSPIGDAYQYSIGNSSRLVYWRLTHGQRIVKTGSGKYVLAPANR